MIILFVIFFSLVSINPIKIFKQLKIQHMVKLIAVLKQVLFFKEYVIINVHKSSISSSISSLMPKAYFYFVVHKNLSAKGVWALS